MIENIVETITTDEEVDALSEEEFQLEASISFAQDVFEELREKELLIEGDFENDRWVFDNEDIAKGIYAIMDFNEMREIAKFNKDLPPEFITLVKCWITTILDKRKIRTAAGYFYVFKRILEQSNSLREESVDDFVDWLLVHDVGDNTKLNYINALSNFFTYSELSVLEIYNVRLLEDVKSTLKLTQEQRKLPPSKEVLTFSYYLEKYCEEHLRLKKENEFERVLYLPVLIWWQVSNIIPLRASEFCLIQRNCFVIEQEGNKEVYKIKVQRIKDPKNLVQLPHTFQVSEEIYELIEEYKALTEKYGETETLISYQPLVEMQGKHIRHKRVKGRFARNILNGLIQRFYQEIINDFYGLEIPKEHWVKPNDTRHLAICSLMMQGISPVEIARMAGHTKISTQYHYSNHVEYWIDSEVFKLMSKFKHADQFKKNSNNSNKNIPNKIKDIAFRQPKGMARKKLDLGFCTDEYQRCKTSICMECEWWDISPKEFVEKKYRILEKLSEKKEKITELAVFLENLNRQILNDELSKMSSDSATEVKTKVREIQSEVSQLATMNMNLLKPDIPLLSVGDYLG